MWATVDVSMCNVPLDTEYLVSETVVLNETKHCVTRNIKTNTKACHGQHEKTKPWFVWCAFYELWPLASKHGGPYSFNPALGNSVKPVKRQYFIVTVS